MSILIKGEPMPVDCWECWAMMSITYNEETCHTCLMEVSAGKGYVDDFLQTGKRPEWCPLVEVPAVAEEAIEMLRREYWFEDAELKTVKQLAAKIMDDMK